MGRLKFGVKGSDGTYLSIPYTDNDNDTLLAFFISDTRYNVNKVINDLETVASGTRTFDEVRQDYAPWTFANESGELVCNKETARFIGLDPIYSDIEMPLQELIDILYEWKAFIESNR